MCIRCGRDVAVLVDGRLCPDCYLELYGLGRLPQKLVVTICPRCGSYRFQGRWYPPPGDGGIEDVVLLIAQASFKPAEHVEYYRVESVEVDYENERAILVVTGKLRGIQGEHRVTYTVALETKKQLCPACFQRAAGTPAAIVQIRGYDGRLSEEDRVAVEDMVQTMPGVVDAIISVEELREGIDYKMLDANLARHLAAKMRSQMAAMVKESHKVVGRRSDGKRFSRLTLSVRLPFFREGSLVDYNGSLAIVERIANGYVHIRRLGTRRQHRLTVEEAWKKLKKPDIEEHPVIVAAVELGWIHIQYLDGAYNYEELPRSRVKIEGRIEIGGEARLLQYNNTYYLLPKTKH
ncbi:60S ribosomal export protein NMD3 [Hyperthermus butylicus]|nr:60S ribosomal export protein NMD3 [Hyperthermus butylicus]